MARRKRDVAKFESKHKGFSEDVQLFLLEQMLDEVITEKLPEKKHTLDWFDYD